MLLEEIIVCAFIGMVSAGVISLFVTKGKIDAIVLLMMLFGTTIGWILGMIFIFTTGGLELTVEWFVTPVLTTAFFSFFMLRKYRNMKFIRFSKKEKTNKMTLIVAILIVVVLLGSVAVMALPATYESSYATESLSLDDARLLSTRRSYELSSSEANALSVPLSSNGISIGMAKSSVDFPRIAEDPTVGDYLEFQATFAVTASGGDWVQPFIKMAVVSDEDGSGTLTTGDTYWYDSHVKFATESGKNWRTNLIWENDVTVMQMHQVMLGTDVLILPIFHANAITQWKNDNGQIFANTPEQYTSPYDQMSWDLSGTAITLMEDITTFATISTSSSESIKGKIYCPDNSPGQHFVIIQAFDMRYHDPFSATVVPFAQELMIFTVTAGSGYCGDGVCIPPETHENCPEDCPPSGSYCGDGTCDPDENQYNCPEDCGYPPDPVVDITTSSWVVVAFLGIGSIGAIYVAPKLLFKKPPTV